MAKADAKAASGALDAAGESDRAAAAGTSRETTAEASCSSDAALQVAAMAEQEEPSIGVVLAPEQLKSPLDMSGTPFENGQLVECQKCWKRMHAPQRSPYLRCFHCNSVVRPETPAEEAARLRASIELSVNAQPSPAKSKSPTQRTRQPLPHETFARFEAVFQEVKDAEVMLLLWFLFSARVECLANGMPCHVCCILERSPTARHRSRAVVFGCLPLPPAYPQNEC
jgi:hypothetical protein